MTGPLRSEVESYTAGIVYDSDSCARELEARHRLVRKETLVHAVCWLMIAPALPLIVAHFVAEWIAERDPPRWCIWLGEKIEAYAGRNGVRFF